MNQRTHELYVAEFANLLFGYGRNGIPLKTALSEICDSGVFETLTLSIQDFRHGVGRYDQGVRSRQTFGSGRLATSNCRL